MKPWIRISAIAVIFLDVLTVFFSSTGPAYEAITQLDPSDIVQNELRTLSNDNLTHNQNISLTSVIKMQQQKLKGFGLTPNPQIVVYNRVPKCGSTTTLDIIRFLRKKLHYNVFNDIAPKMKHFMESDEQEYGLVRNITQYKRPILYIRHVYFIDFPKYGYRDPLYINIARDPVSLFISNYFYLRFGFQTAKNTTNAQNWKHDMPDERRAMSIDDCVKTEAQECARPYSNLIPFFCGSSSLCQKRGDEAVAIAKQNVLDRYAIVGIMEDFHSTMKAFEVVSPRFFMGASVLLGKANQVLHDRSKTAHKKEPDPATVEYLRKGLKREYELYDFIKKIFYEKIENFKERGLWGPDEIPENKN
ncbi:Oidioi.mRNA.OKI2018_I69.PAR.g9324.t1.cds [Oikopleura dioica]|uniref:Oidioi.mRNA.OKI2018_I69.PAR.g9324.t1.cds n=1 Tax=Oikopleura dioica TaxID=34765 RepID=A0ABN7RK37_OIKDI|nr:Oidioi.mRNA.OKI2018_I69.PAR.g9324.t1.cds [Oikopleura dioica]